MTVLIDRVVYAERAPSGGADSCFAWAAIPQGGRFLGATVVGTVMGSESTSTLGAMVFGLSGYAVPVLDPDTIQASPDAMWDLQVPKDEDVAEDALDFDYRTTSDSTPNMTIGEPNLNIMIGAQVGAKKLFRMERVVTFADSPTGFIAGTPDAYFPTAQVSFRVKVHVSADVPTMVLFAHSAPTPGIGSIFTGNLASWAPRTADEWLKLRYIGDTVKMAAPFLAPAGVETGAESPWEEAAELMQRSTIQSFEDTSGAFINMAQQSFMKSRMQIEVPGHLMMNRVSAG